VLDNWSRTHFVIDGNINVIIDVISEVGGVTEDTGNVDTLNNMPDYINSWIKNERIKCPTYFI
jgi:hypothetical protein